MEAGRVPSQSAGFRLRRRSRKVTARVMHNLGVAQATYGIRDANRRRQSREKRFTRLQIRAEPEKETTSLLPRNQEKAVEFSGAEIPDGYAWDWKSVLDRAIYIGKPYWTSESGKSGRNRLIVVTLLTLASTGASVCFSFLGRDFFSALSEKHSDEFIKILCLFAGSVLAALPIFVLRDFYQSQLSLYWRQWLTEHYISKYFTSNRFYQIQAGQKIDNPDQRIVDDVGSFCGSSLGLMQALFRSTIDLVSFSGILFSIDRTLLIVLLGYSIGGTYLTIRFGRPLIGLNFNQEKREADFRYSLVRVRENAEGIAFYGGQNAEQNIIVNRFKGALDNFFALNVATRNLDFFTTAYRFIIMFLPAAVVAPLYFAGKVEMGVVTQSQSAFSHILSDVSIIVYQFQSFATFAATVNRLAQFDSELDEANDESGEDVKKIGLDYTLLGPLLQTDNLTLVVPKRNDVMKPRTLVRDLNMAVNQHSNLLIVGPSGVGKTSLLRSFAGLWKSGTGNIQLSVTPPGVSVNVPTLEDPGVSLTNNPQQPHLFFVPQKPYLVLGSLRRNVLYPTWASGGDPETPEIAEKSGSSEFGNAPSDAEIISVLKSVGLGSLLTRSEKCESILDDATIDWSQTLSLGEQQRLAFSRLLLAKPKLALLDESTSALDIASEASMYQMLERSGVTVISVGHRPSLIKYHSNVLHMSPSGSADMIPAGKFDPESTEMSEMFESFGSTLDSTSKEPPVGV